MITLILNLEHAPATAWPRNEQGCDKTVRRERVKIQKTRLMRAMCGFSRL
jgi:hypothetical protein